MNSNMPTMNNGDDGLVPKQCACPTCGENRCDELVFIGLEEEDDNRVRCSSCGTIYDPLEEGGSK